MRWFVFGSNSYVEFKDEKSLNLFLESLEKDKFYKTDEGWADDDLPVSIWTSGEKRRLILPQHGFNLKYFLDSIVDKAESLGITDFCVRAMSEDAGLAAYAYKLNMDTGIIDSLIFADYDALAKIIDIKGIVSKEAFYQKDFEAPNEESAFYQVREALYDWIDCAEPF